MHYRLGTEAIIFFFSALKNHEEPDWSLVYPELAYMNDPNDASSKTPTQELDNMLKEKANVDQALITRLGANLPLLQKQLRE